MTEYPDRRDYLQRLRDTLKEIMDKSPNPHLAEERARALATLPGRAFPNLGLVLSQDEEEFERIVWVILYWVADAYDALLEDSPTSGTLVDPAEPPQLVGHPLRGDLPQADHVRGRRALDEVEDQPRHRRHDPLVLVGVAVPVVDVGHLAGLVVRHPVHGVAPEAQPRDHRQAGAPQVVGRGALDPVLGHELLHPRGAGLGARPLGEVLIDQRLRGLRQPDPVVSAVLGPRPIASGLPRHLPPALRRCADARMAATSPGRWPVSRISRRPVSSRGHSSLTSASESTRSRLVVGLRSTPLHGLTVTISCLIAQEKIADAEASTWLATIGASILSIMCATSARVIACAFSLPHLRHQVLGDELLGLPPALVVLLRVQLDVLRGQVCEGPRGALRLALGDRVLALHDGEHDLLRLLARIGQRQ